LRQQFDKPIDMNFDFEADIELSNERTQIRPLKIEDLQHLLPVATQHKDLVRFSPVLIHSEGHLRDYISQAVQERKNNIRYAFIIWDKLKNQYAGSTSFLNISNKDKRLEIGSTWIGKDFQGTGLNAKVKALMLAYAFEKLEFERVEFRTDERNTASRKAMEKLGAIYEGRLRSHILMPDGFRRSSLYYSILRDEWLSKK